MTISYREMHAELKATLNQWQQRAGDFNAGDAATDVLAVLVEHGLVEPAQP